MIVPVYNEEEHSRRRSQCPPNGLSLEQARGYFVSDGSTDRSNSILETLNESNIKVIYKRARKADGVKRGVEQAINPFLLCRMEAPCSSRTQFEC